MVVAKLATTNYGTPSPKARPMFNLLRLTDGMATVALWRDVATLEDPLLCVARLAEGRPSVAELDLNPVIAHLTRHGPRRQVAIRTAIPEHYDQGRRS